MRMRITKSLACYIGNYCGFKNNNNNNKTICYNEISFFHIFSSKFSKRKYVLNFFIVIN